MLYLIQMVVVLMIKLNSITDIQSGIKALLQNRKAFFVLLTSCSWILLGRYNSVYAEN